MGVEWEHRVGVAGTNVPPNSLSLPFKRFSVQLPHIVTYHRSGGKCPFDSFYNPPI